MSKTMRASRAAAAQKLHLTDTRFEELTAQLRGVYETLDSALVRSLRLHADMVETAQEIGLEPEEGQKLFVECTSCTGAIVDSRKRMVDVHTRATIIRMRTNQAERGWGCWDGMTQEEPVKQLRSVA